MNSQQPANSIYVSYDKSLKVINTIFLCWGFITIVNASLLATFSKAVQPSGVVLDFFLGLENLSGGLLKFSTHHSLIFGFIFYCTYFICGLPAAYLIKRTGVKKSMEIGLIIGASAVFILVPGARSQSFTLLMTGIFIQATGITILQTTCNPYVIFVGRSKEGASRLAFAGAHNSFGAWVAPFIGTLISVAVPEGMIGSEAVIYQTELIVLPYVLITVLFAGMAVLIHFSDLPEMNFFQNLTEKEKSVSILKHKHVVLGFFAIMTYVCAEVLIAGKLIEPFLANQITAKELAQSIGLVATYFAGCMMVGRFIGSSILKTASTEKVLAICGLFALICTVLSMIIPTQEAMFFILAIGLFNGPMWPAIFDLGVRNTGKKMPYASGILVMGIIGAAIAIYLFQAIYVPIEIDLKSHQSSLKTALIPVIICYTYIIYYAVSGYKSKPLT